MTMAIRGLLLGMAFLGMQLCSTAQTGIRFSVLDFERSVNSWQWNLLGGFDRDINDRMSIGVDVTRSLLFFGLGDLLDYDPYSTYGQDYALAQRSFGLQYRSSYFWSDMGYIASTIGFRSIAMELNADRYNSNYNLIEYRRTERFTLIPVGLRLGFRNDLDGWYNDVYVGLGYNIGGGKTIFDGMRAGGEKIVLEKKHELKKIWFSAGYSFGIGW